eukprot:INCI17613.11.p1 GENE.INCI17613.11~~INCI17613.11.p1  ORF type:complete len:251 (-),score=47.55 INCI17613.11:141-893(-)
MSRLQDLSVSLLTQELYNDVLSERPAPEGVAGEDSVVSTPVGTPRPLSRGPPATTKRRSGRSSSSPSSTSFAGAVLSGVRLCCSCFRSKHTGELTEQKNVMGRKNNNKKKKKKEKKKIRGKMSKSQLADKSRTVTYIDTDRRRDAQLRARLQSSKRYAAYLKECNEALLARLTSTEGKALIKQMAKDEEKSVPEVVELLVKGLQEQAIREYIKRVKSKDDGLAELSDPGNKHDAVNGQTGVAEQDDANGL